MARVAVVTDSTAYLPRGAAEAAGVLVVPLHVVIGGRSGLEGEVGAADVARALGAWEPVSTSRPTPEELASKYRAAAAGQGAAAVVAVHLSARLSGTVDAARLAAASLPDLPVTVVDSRSTAMGLGFPVLAAAAAAREGRDAEAVADAARWCSEGTLSVFVVDTLEHLRRGGRIGAAAAMVGAALSVKPVLQVRDGTISLLEKVRTLGRATARLEELAVQAVLSPARPGGVPAGSYDVAVHHLGAPERAARLHRALVGRLGERASVVTAEVGAVVGAHVGPGVVGVVVSPRPLRSPGIGKPPF